MWPRPPRSPVVPGHTQWVEPPGAQQHPAQPVQESRVPMDPVTLALPTGHAPAVGQSQWPKCPVSHSVLLQHSVTGCQHAIHHQCPMLGQRCKGPLSLLLLHLGDPGETDPDSSPAPNRRHQHTLSWLGVAGVHCPKGGVVGFSPLWAVPLGDEDQVGSSQGQLGPRLGMQCIEDPPCCRVAVQEG